MHRSGSRVRGRVRGRPRVRTVVATCALVLASLGAAPAPARAPTPTPAPAPAPVATGGHRDPLAPFHAQRIRWGDCPEAPVPDGMRCAVVKVPLDYAAPGRGTVEVALARLPATDPKHRLGSLLLNFGGPGAEGIATLAADHRSFADLGERYDLVAFDPRGVGHSDPVTCGGARQGEDGPATDAAAQLADLRAAVRRCELASGPVLPYIGTVHVSRDMDVLRRLLGDEKLNFLGFSYGTRLGAVYAAQFPRTTGRMVLDGVDTLSEPLVEQALISARGQQRALDNFLTWCTHQVDCVYGTNTRTAKEEVADLVARLDERPLVGHDGTYVTGRAAASAIGDALYARSAWPELAAALALAERNHDPVGLLTLGGPPERSGPPRSPGPVGATDSIRCPPTTSPPPWPP